MKQKKKTVVFVACESEPFVKVGGLADVVGSLVRKVKTFHNVALFLPGFSTVTKNVHARKVAEYDISFGETRKEHAIILKVKESFGDLYLVVHPEYFDRPGIYGEQGVDYPDNLERFSFFSKAVLEACVRLDLSPSVFHCHDWQSALLPLYRKVWYDNLLSAGTVFTIHNLAYQGIFEPEFFSSLGIGKEFYRMESLEFFEKVNIMKAGILYADFITTVSPTYAKEILTPEYGYRLDGLLTMKKDTLFGILNGIDYRLWNPMFDDALEKKYRSRKGKLMNKTALQRRLGLELDPDIPLFGFVGRLVEQKGIDLLCSVLQSFKLGKKQIAILGNGDLTYEALLANLAGEWPDEIAFMAGFDDSLARNIYAGSDFFLMPSRFEPCGLGQLIALKYGSVPVCRKTGGLADTIEEIDRQNKEGWGFLFDEARPEKLAEKMQEAITLYEDDSSMEALFSRAVARQYSWDLSVSKYLELYERSWIRA
ncbi:MAG: glycogen/starch synthase [Candidatus Ratteibacteria bacterium]|jgi:starch synthase